LNGKPSERYLCPRTQFKAGKLKNILIIIKGKHFVCLRANTPVLKRKFIRQL